MLTQEQQDLYTRIAKDPETFVIVAWDREDLRDMLREEDIEPSEENVDRLLNAREFPADYIQDKMVETGWDMLHDIYDGVIDIIREDLECRKAAQETNVAEQAARLREDGEYHGDAQAWLDRWMADGWRSTNSGTVEEREREVFDAMLEANGLGQLPTEQCECLFSQAQEINSMFESVIVMFNVKEVTAAYSRTATFDNIIQHAAMLLKPDDENGDPNGIHAEGTAKTK